MAHGINFNGGRKAIGAFSGNTRSIDLRMAIAHMDGNRLFVYVSPKEINEGEKPETNEDVLNKELLAEWTMCDPRMQEAPTPHHMLEFADDGWFRWTRGSPDLHSKNKEALLSWIQDAIKKGDGIARFIIELEKMRISDSTIVAERLTIVDFSESQYTE